MNLTTDQLMTTFPRPRGVPSLPGQRTQGDLAAPYGLRRDDALDRLVDEIEAPPAGCSDLDRLRHLREIALDHLAIAQRSRLGADLIERVQGRIAEVDRLIAEEEVEPDDGYSAMVEYLTAHPEQIYEAWSSLSEHPCGMLFQYAVGPGMLYSITHGCLTQIRNNPMKSAHTPELTDAIRDDVRIPTDGTSITVAHLPTFAMWQRKLDRELGRTPPAWTPPQ